MVEVCVRLCLEIENKEEEMSEHMCNHWLTTVVLLTSLSLTACGADGSMSLPGMGPGEPPPTTAQVNLRKEADGLDNWTVAAGCATGAAVGVLLGAAVGAMAGGRDQAVAGGAIGGLGGAAIGCGSGYYVAAKNQSYANAQDALRGRIEAANKEVERYSMAAANAKTVVAQHSAAVAKLNTQLTRKQTSVESYHQQIAGIETDASAIRTLIAESNKAASVMQQDIDAGNGDAKLIAARARLLEERSQLEAELDALGTVVARIPPEVGAPAIS